MDDITTFLKEWTDAERAGDTAVLESALTDDFVGVGPLGFTLPKAAWLARHRAGDLRYDTFALDEIDARPHGDAALVTARHLARGNYQGHPIPEATRATLALVHETRRTAAPGPAECCRHAGHLTLPISLRIL